MELNEEHISHGATSYVSLTTYKGPTGEVIQKAELVKDLGVTLNKKREVKEQIEKIVMSSPVMTGMII